VSRRRTRTEAYSRLRRSKYSPKKKDRMKRHCKQCMRDSADITADLSAGLPALHATLHSYTLSVQSNLVLKLLQSRSVHCLVKPNEGMLWPYGDKVYQHAITVKPQVTTISRTLSILYMYVQLHWLAEHESLQIFSELSQKRCWWAKTWHRTLWHGIKVPSLTLFPTLWQGLLVSLPLGFFCLSTLARSHPGRTYFSDGLEGIPVY
jgi:hypothetical protein